ncbi:hypothetical protein IFM89_029071 [Coptis chinensis]|uniref:Uncharacterized protein n=1 Tax=Coptis chinensis TaxID=261450 RepID=A0A835ICA6_9MAGN|nr:hypothetical protein IFM89_029071 [Coptis chinensis]
MKPSSIFFLYLIALCLSSLNITHASSPSITSTLLKGRRTLRTIEFEKLNHHQQDHNIKVAGKDWFRADAKRLAVGEDEVDEDGDGLLYHIDYHGVSTHPYPSPKHPRP